MSSAAERLAELEAAVREAQGRFAAARRAQETEQDFAAEVAGVFADLRDDVLYRHREASVEDQRALTQEFMDRIERDGLVLEAFGPGRGVLTVRDPSIALEASAALDAVNDAKRELSKFRRAHDAELAAERKAREAEAFREALDAGDVDAVREALDPDPGASRRTLLRSEDVVPA